jgi:hypothetical protein
MTERSLQVTYRKGRAFAAYLHLSHVTGEKSAENQLLAELGEAPLAEHEYKPVRAA